MEVLIPFSGGINSTYALYRWLTETDHNITAIYAIESWVGVKNGDSWRQSRETTAVNNMVEWLKTNCREFTLEQKNDCPVTVEDMRPIRDGFTQLQNYGIVVARYQGYSNIIDALEPDIFVPGLSVENTATDCHPALRQVWLRDGMQVCYAGTRDMSATPNEPFDYEVVAANLSGRFEQLESIPDDLQALMANKCDCDRSEWEKFACLPCGWQKSREALSHMTGKEFDEMFAEYGSYGAWRNEADPATYTYRGFPYKKFAEIIGVPDNVVFD
jgi:hypothetical protein